MPKISDDLIRRLSLGDRTDIDVRDSQLRGFVLRVRRRADGSLLREFCVVKETRSTDGRRHKTKVSIGRHPTWSADAARDEARSMLQALDRGEDPAAKRQASRSQPVFKEAVLAFDADHISRKAVKSQGDYRGRINRNLLPIFGRHRVADISSGMIREFMRSKLGNPIDANRSLAVLSRFMTFAIEQGWRSDNPCKGIRRYPETPREAWLDEIALPRFLLALDTATGPAAECIRFLLLSGWRVSEALDLTWGQVDVERRLARIPTKVGHQERALSVEAAAVLAARPPGIGFAFWSRSAFTRLGYRTVATTLKAVCVRAEIAPITPHVLRHTAATWAAIGGAEAHELREAFGWKTLAMTGRYVGRADSLGRRGVQRAADAMLAAGRGGAVL